MSAAWDRVRRAMGFASVERDVDDEIRFHIDSRANDLIRGGASPDDARRIAEREFGNVAEARAELAVVDRNVRAKERRALWWDALRHDLRFSWRSLVGARGLTTMVVVLLALGVGANAAVLSVADQLFFRQPDGVKAPESLRRLYLRTSRSLGRPGIQTEVAFLSSRVIADAIGPRGTLTVFTPSDSLDSRIGGARAFVRASYVQPNFLPLVGARIARGRVFNESEGAMGDAQRLAVISYALWESRFDRDAGVIGQPMEIAGERYTIVGVTDRGFAGVDLDRTDVWLPLATMPYSREGNWYLSWRQNSSMRMLVRPAPGVSDHAIEMIATQAYRRGSVQFDQGSKDTAAVIVAGPLLESLGPSIAQSAEQAITPRLIAVAVMLLVVACANVANLLLLRGLRRRRELAMRVALGISRQRLFRQVLFEGFVIALVAGAMSVIVAGVGTSVLRSIMMPSVHWATSVWSPRLGLIAVPIALVAGIIAGIAPAAAAFEADVVSALKSSGREGAVRLSRVRIGLVVVQGALSVVLLIGAGLFIRSFDAVRSIDVGYDLADVSYGTALFRDPQKHFIDPFASDNLDELTTGLKRAAAQLQRSPNVKSLALSYTAPMAMYAMTRAFTSNGQQVAAINRQDLMLLTVSPAYFDVTGLRLVRGRLFTDDDAHQAGEVIVINETAARTIWPGQEALGQCLMVSTLKAPCATVIGITRDVHISKFLEPPTQQVFQPLETMNRHSHAKTLIVRAKPGRAAAATAELARELERALPTAEPPYVRNVLQAREPELRPWRLGAVLFGTFGGLALLVATIGVYSVMAFSVSQRTHEMGVRIALGARGRDIARIVGVQAVWPVVIGVVVGIVLTFAVTGAVAGMLFGVTPTDPVTIGWVAGILVITGVVGSAAPAWRAVRVSPVEALRAD